MREGSFRHGCAGTYNDSTVIAAAKEETTSGLLALLAETRVRGLPPQTGTSGCSWVTSTLRWGSWQVYDGTAVDRLVGLDYFGARYFSSAQGRCTSVDPKQFPHDITDPQIWNKYAYTRNNPLQYIGPDGEDWKDVVKGVFNGYTSDVQLGVGRAKGGNSDLSLRSLNWSI
jgi:RHS repeat-associated protein